MTTRWPEVARVFDDVLRLPPDARSHYLLEACDIDLRSRVNRLLLAHEEAEASGFLDLPQVERDLTEALPAHVGPYRVTGLLGTGGMGVVLAAHDDRLDRPVAIKVLKPLANDRSLRRRLKREAQLLASIRHPHVATLYSFEETESECFLTMEAITGVGLDQRLAESNLTILDALRVLRQVAVALDVVHAKGVLHRDLKPENVMLDESGQVKVLDFGIGQSVSTGETTLTLIGAMNGTPGYMSPEQLRGAAADTRTDIWSFGSLAFECLAGVRAFPGESHADRVAETLRGEPRWELLPSSTPGDIRTMLGDCLEEDPEKRPPDVQTILGTLDRAIDVVRAHRNGTEARCGIRDDTSRSHANRRGRGRGRRILLRTALATLAIVLLGLGARGALLRFASPRWTGATVSATAPILGRLWELSHRSEIADLIQVPWKGGRAVAYGLHGTNDDGGTVFVRSLTNGDLRWSYQPDLEEVSRVFEVAPRLKGAFSAHGSFRVRALLLADLDGDDVDELIVVHLHNSWFPAIVSALDSGGDRIGSYYLPGHSYAVRVTDLDGDGRDEVIAGGTDNGRNAGSVVLLDADHWHGAVRDPENPYTDGLPEAALARVVFPPFDEAILAEPGVSGRPWVEDIRVGSHEGSSLITVALQVSDDAGLVITLDDHLVPTRVSISDGWMSLVNTLGPAARELAASQAYLDAWVAGSDLYGALHQGP